MPNRLDRPRLSIKEVLQWADEHYKRTGTWPKIESGAVPNTTSETWSGIDTALYAGTRGLPGGSSLAKLLAEHRSVRNIRDLPVLTEEQILRWADKYFRRTRKWPQRSSGEVTDAPRETWSAVNSALCHGARGLSGNSSLAKLLARRRGVRNRMDRPRLSTEKILQWADKHYKRTGVWPKVESGAISDAPGETWLGINASLGRGNRGLSGNSSLVQLLAKRRGVRNRMDRPRLSTEKILQWADKHYKRTGVWPKVESGAISDAPGETWLGINHSLGRGNRALPGGLSLAKILAKHRGVRNEKDLPSHTVEQILQWADRHYERTGRWPTAGSGEIADARGEKWSGVNVALQHGARGLPGGSTLAKLLAKHRGSTT